MKNIPKLSELGGASLSNNDQNIIEQPDLEIFKVKTEYRREMQSRQKEISSKIAALESKIKKHELKEGMLDNIIAGTYTELENLKENEFSKRGQKQTVLIKQLEALSILHDTIMKYEDMIQKYHKILLDIENNKFNSFLKIESLKKEEDKANDNLSEVLQELQQMLRSDSNGITENIFMEEIKKELEDNNY
jgi:hypothetical protein